MKKYLLLSLILSATTYTASLDHIQTYSPDYLANQAQTGMTNAVSAYYNPAGLTRLEEGKYVHAGLQYAFGYEKMSYKNKGHKAKLSQFLPNISLSSVDNNGAYFMTFGGLGGGGELTYKNGVSGLDVAIDEFNLTGLGLKDNGTNVTGSSEYEQLTLGRAFNVDEKLSFSVAGRVIHGTRNLKGDLKVSINEKEFNPGKFKAFSKNKAKEAYIKEIENKVHSREKAQQIFKANETKFDKEFENKFNAKISSKEMEYVLKNGLSGDINAKREAWGYGFQLGVNYKASEKLNLAARYDSRVKLNFKTKGNENKLPSKGIIGKDIGFSTFYPEYVTDIRRDLPAILAVGASYKATDKWLVSTAGNFYFNHHAKMDRINGKGTAYKNGWELALGNEYKLNDKITLIGSINYARTGANKKTYSDVEYALNSITLGTGVRYKYDETLDLTASLCHFIYEGAEGNFIKDHPKVAKENQKYKKSISAVGFSITKKF